MKKLLDILIPRFVTDRTAVKFVEDKWYIVCHENDLTEEDDYDYVVDLKSFNFFGFGLFCSFELEEE